MKNQRNNEKMKNENPKNIQRYVFGCALSDSADVIDIRHDFVTFFPLQKFGLNTYTGIRPLGDRLMNL